MPIKNDDEPEITADDLLGDEPADDALLAAIEDEDMDGLDPNHPILSLDEQREAKREARIGVDKKRKKAALEAYIKLETERLQHEEGLVTGIGIKDELVDMLIDVAEYTDRIVLNNVTYFHGHSVRVPRHVAETLREICARSHNHQNEIDGKNLSERFRRQALHEMRPVAVLSGKAA